MTRKSKAAAAPAPAPAGVERNVVVNDNLKLGALLGPLDRFAVRLEQKLDVRVARRGNQLTVSGQAHEADAAVAALRALEARLDLTGELAMADVDAAIKGALQGDAGEARGSSPTRAATSVSTAAGTSPRR